MAKLAEDYVPTGCIGLDRALGGGFPRGKISLLYGGAGTGKTSLAIQCAVLCSRRGEKALYVDSGGGFNVERLAQTAGDALPSVTENLIVFTPQSFHEQVLLVEAIDRYVTRSTGVLVVDTVTGYYRLELSGVHETFASNRQLNRMMAYLKQLAATRRVAVLAIGQVRASLAGPSNGRLQGIEPVARHVLDHWSSVSVRLSPTPVAGVKEWAIERGRTPETAGLRSLLAVTARGVSDASEATPSARSGRSTWQT